MSFLSNLFGPGKAPASSSTAVQPSSTAESPAICITKQFSVYIRAMEDILEIYSPEQKSTLQVFTRYSSGKEDCVVTWHPSLSQPLRDPKKITALVNFIFAEYPLCLKDQVEKKYDGNVSIFRNLSGTNNVTPQAEYATRFVFASRILKHYTQDFLEFLRSKQERAYAGLRQVPDTADFSAAGSSSSAGSTSQQIGREREWGKPRQEEPTLERAALADLTYLRRKELEEREARLQQQIEHMYQTALTVKNIGTEEEDIIKQCKKYLSEVPRNPWSKYVEAAIEKMKRSAVT